MRKNIDATFFVDEVKVDENFVRCWSLIINGHLNACVSTFLNRSWGEVVGYFILWWQPSIFKGWPNFSIWILAFTFSINIRELGKMNQWSFRMEKTSTYWRSWCCLNRIRYSFLRSCHHSKSRRSCFARSSIEDSPFS